MRCIEIQPWIRLMHTVNRLTLTWDVLKFLVSYPNTGNVKGLTLTWDVLKWTDAIQSGIIQCKININMRCIEIN